MKNRRYTALLAALVALLVLSQAGAEEKLVSGKDRIDVPAIGNGLCLHNLFQSGMVLQRDKPIRICGWAEPGENVSVTFGGQTESAISPVLPATPIYGHWVLLKDESKNSPLRVSPHSVQRKMLMRMCRSASHRPSQILTTER